MPSGKALLDSKFRRRAFPVTFVQEPENLPLNQKVRHEESPVHGSVVHRERGKREPLGKRGELEQVRDMADIPARERFLGKGTGSGTRLVWAYSEYVKLRHSLFDGKTLDQSAQTVELSSRKAVSRDTAES
jgi:hypothetical protein